MFAVFAWAGGEAPAIAVEAFETRQAAETERDRRAPRYPRWQFYVAEVRRIE